MTDPPEWAAPAVAECENAGCWPVLADPDGGRQVVLSSPIILSDHPEVAPESPGELYDGTEIDEILTLRTLALSDEEKVEARATDPRAAALIDRVESMDAATMQQLHGTIRASGGRQFGLAAPAAAPAPSARAALTLSPPSAPAGWMPRSAMTRRRPGGIRKPIPRCPRTPTRCWSAASGSRAAAWSGCGPAHAAPTRRTCSWPAGSRWSRRC